MDTDDILKQLGECGKYQQLLLWFVLLPSAIPCAFHAYLQIFLSIKPQHWCYVPELSYNTVVDSHEIRAPKFNDYLSECEMFDRNYSSSIINLQPESQNITNCKNGWVYNRTKFSSTIVTEWDLVCEHDFLITVALVCFGIGGLVGNLAFGYFQDSIGRKPAFFLYLLIQCIFSIMSIFSVNFTMWLILRFGVGLTVPAILGTPMVLALELVGPNRRTMVFILINIAFSIGLLLLSGVVYIFRDWRQLTLATSLPFIIFFGFWWFMPESPRWLIGKRRFKEAELIFKRMAKVNGKPLDNNFDLDVLINNEQESHTNHKINYGIYDLLKTPSLRKNTMIITFIWFTNTAVYVGLSYYAPSLGGDEFWNFFLAALVELPTYLVLWPSMEKIGRRWILFVSMIIGGLACMITIMVEQGKMGISSSFVAVPLVASEIYPTVVRGLGMSFSGVVAQIGPILIPLVNHLGNERLVLPLFIMGTLLVTGAFCSLLLPETLREHLPQNLEDASKPRKKNCQVSCSKNKL